MMDGHAARAVITEVLGEIAPEVDLDTIDPDAPLQDEVDLDSIGFLDFVSGLHDRTGAELPERDYPQVSTLAGAVAYLAEHAS
jgi:acyl carrier protein